MSWHMQISGEGKNHVEPSAYWMLKQKESEDYYEVGRIDNGVELVLLFE